MLYTFLSRPLQKSFGKRTQWKKIIQALEKSQIIIYFMIANKILGTFGLVQMHLIERDCN